MKSQRNRKRIAALLALCLLLPAAGCKKQTPVVEEPVVIEPEAKEPETPETEAPETEKPPEIMRTREAYRSAAAVSSSSSVRFPV